MNKLTWYVQSSINANAHDKIFDICENLNIPFISVPVIPFSLSLPDEIDFSTKGIPYGSNTYIALASENSFLNETTFYDEYLLSPEKYYKELGNKFLNEPKYIGTIRDLPEFEEIFMKCNSDNKVIIGDTYTKKDIVELKYLLKNTYNDMYFDDNMVNIDLLSSDTVVYCSSLKTLSFETRNIFINGNWITGSYYKIGDNVNKIKMDRKSDNSIIEFAKECIDTYNPFEISVIDIGESCEGLKCIEYNCFNASAWYDCDYYTIIELVTEYLSN
jgi:hypothetical protein